MKKSVLYIILGLIIFGGYQLLFGSTTQKTAFAIILGALRGVYIGWVVAVFVCEKKKNQNWRDWPNQSEQSNLSLLEEQEITYATQHIPHILPNPN